MSHGPSQRHESTPGASQTRPRPSDWASTPFRDMSPENLGRRDVFGRNILHICILANNTQRLAEVLAMPVSKSLLTATDYENGWNVLHYVFYLKRMACFGVLWRHFSDLASNVLAELLKRKDRCRKDPLSLLNNDIQKFYWIPDYINEYDQFHLSKRRPACAPRPASAPESWWTPQRGASGAYAFGSNTYGNLGLGSSHDRAGPTHIRLSWASAPASARPDTSATVFPRLRDMHVSNYHAVLVTTSGEVYTCGAAKRGRLGHGTAQNSNVFRPVPSLYAVSECAVSNGHTVALTGSKRLFTWGSNRYGQLGYETTKSVHGSGGDIYVASPQEIAFFRKRPQPLVGVAVSNVHSLAYTADTLFFWGLNIGQMGVPLDNVEDFVLGHVTHSGRIHHEPKNVAMRETIRSVATCDTCTVVVTEANDAIVFFSHSRAKLPKVAPMVDPSLHFEVFKPSVMTRPPLIKKVVVKSQENILLLLDTGDVVQCVFNSASPKTSRYQPLWTPLTANMQAVDMASAGDGSLILCTMDGSVFTKALGGDIHARRGSAGITPKRNFSKVEGVNRVVRVSCSDSFASFGLLRDDIDPLPYKLQQNDFFKDMEYLSPLVEPDAYRKQDQLLDVDHDANCYIWPQFEGEKSESEVSDRLLTAYAYRHTAAELVPQTYQTITTEDLATHNKLLRACMQRTVFQLDWSQSKFCDGKIVSNGITLAFHHGLFHQRSAFCRQLFRGADEYFLHQSIRGHYSNGTIWFETDIEPIALLVFVHFVYTNSVLDFWSQGLKSEKELQIRSHFRDIVGLFRMDSYESDAVFLRQISQLDEQFGDVLVGLADGVTIRCSSFIICRSAFFETILAWDGLDTEDDCEKYVSLENITQEQMNVIMRHLKGCNDLEVLRPEQELFADPDDFANFVLGMIDICDELLLVQLKRLCELAIQNHISIENVLVLLSHSDGLNAPKLFMSCCWYIYHNLEVVLFDPYFKDIDEGLWKRVEYVLEFLDKCKEPEFVVGEKGEVNWHVRGSTPSAESVDDFLLDLARYNETYMSDRKGYSSFVPIFEVSEDDSRRRKSSQKTSRTQEASMSEMRDHLKRVALSERPGSASESAVEDDDFEMVTRRKKRDEPKTERRDRKDDRGLEREKTLERDKASERGKASGGDPETELGPTTETPGSMEKSTTIESATSRKTPMLGEFIHAEKHTTKIKFSPAMKLSQKERKAKNQVRPQPGNGQSNGQSNSQSNGPLQSITNGPDSHVEREQFRNPWTKTPSAPKRVSSRAAPAVRTAMITGKTDMEQALQDLPVLGQEPKKATKSAKKMSNATEEDALKAQKATQPIQTLQEIQQEQEFARWWEEECRRVQMEEANLLRLARGDLPRRGGFRGRGRGRGRGH